jgi:nucleotide-binding universal stress UspA family protein
METVVVGLDVPSARAEPLLWASDYCRLSGDELVGVVAYRPSESEVPPDWYEEEVAGVRKQAEAVLDAIKPAVAHRLEVLDGDPRAVIAEAASDERAAMVVVGARGSGGFGGLGLGSVAHHLSHHLLTPLVIVPALGGPLRGSSVVVGLDGSPGDVVTLDWAVRLAHTVEGRVRAVYASDPAATSYPHPRRAAVADQVADQKEMAVRDQVAKVAAAGADIAVVVEADHPVTALIRVADQQDASVVVVGRKGAGHLRGVLLGRVPAQLPFHSRRPVAIVPRQASDWPAGDELQRARSNIRESLPFIHLG